MKRMATIAAAAILLAGAAQAQGAFPTKQIRILVGFPAGGSTDILARAAAHEARSILGQELIIINKPGATSTIAMGEVASAAPDGYTIGIAPSGVMTLTPLVQTVPADLLDRTEALIVAGAQRTGIATEVNSPYKNINDLFAAMKASPGKISIGTPGAGTTGHIILRAIMLDQKLEGNLVPFQGDAPVVQALLGQHVNAGFMSAAGFSEMIRAKRMRLLASMEDERLDIDSSVPTLIEQGFNYTSGTLQYFMAPKGLPPEIRKRLIAALTEATSRPAYVELAKKNSLYGPSKMTGAELDAFFLKARETARQLVTRLGIGRKK